MALPLIHSISGALERLPNTSPWATHQKVFFAVAAMGATTLIVAAIAEKFFIFALGILLVYTGLLGSHILKQIPSTAPVISAKPVFQKASAGLQAIGNTIAASDELHGKVHSRSSSFDQTNEFAPRDALLQLLDKMADLLLPIATILKGDQTLNASFYQEQAAPSAPSSPSRLPAAKPGSGPVFDTDLAMLTKSQAFDLNSLTDSQIDALRLTESQLTRGDLSELADDQNS